MDLQDVLAELNRIHEHMKYGELYDTEEEIVGLIMDVEIAIAEDNA